MGRNLPLILAIVSGILAASIAYVYFQRERQRAMILQQRLYQQQQQLQRLSDELRRMTATKRVEAKVPVVVAKEDIKAGTILTSEMVEEIMVPRSRKLPASAGSLDAVIGKLVTVDLVKGEQVLMPRLVSPDVLRRQVIPLGRRLVTVQVQQLDLFRFIKPGDKVDIALMFNLPPSQMVTAGLFSNVEIKAVNGVFYASRGPKGKESSRSIRKRRDDEGKERVPFNPNQGTLTFALPPRDAAILLMASQLGSIRIFPRSRLDTDETRIPPVTVDAVLQYAIPELLKQASEMAKAKEQAEKAKQALQLMGQRVAPKPATRTIKIRKGGVVEVKEILLKGETERPDRESIPQVRESRDKEMGQKILSMFKKALLTSEEGSGEQKDEEEGTEVRSTEEKESEEGKEFEERLSESEDELISPFERYRPIKGGGL